MNSIPKNFFMTGDPRFRVIMNRMFRHDRINPWDIFDVSLIRSYRLLQWLVTVRTTFQGMRLAGSYFFPAVSGKSPYARVSCHDARCLIVIHGGIRNRTLFAIKCKWIRLVVSSHPMKRSRSLTFHAALAHPRQATT